MTVRGFSHLHQSGTGGIKYYYNYAIVSPFYGELSNAFNYSVLDSEKAVPGLYTASYNDITASVTTTHDVAFHQYKFNKKGGRIAVDFSNDGLSRQFSKSFYNFVKDAIVEIDSDNFIHFTGVLSGIKLYFSVKVDAKNVKIRLFENDIEVNEKSLVIKNPKNPFGAVIDFDGDVAFVKVSYSTINFLNAKNAILNVNSTFNEVSSKAYKIWNDYLSKIDVQSNDEDFKTKFYSNLYHSIIKPCDMTGESVLGISGAVVTDFATFWDQYKTALPLIYTLYSDVSKKIVDSIINISKTLNKLPCSFGLTDIFPCEEQAKMLALLTPKR